MAATFSAPGLHSLVYADDFCDFARDIRAELLAYPRWAEMTQYGRFYESAILSDRQNGISARGLFDDDRGPGAHCGAFRQQLQRRAADLCALVGVDAHRADLDVEISAMAYGEGGWLAPHTDHRDDEARPRLAAFILYLTDPQDGEWTPDKGGALRLFGADGRVDRLAPRFNRFALFKTGDDSLHEIEPVTWPCGWERCRLALSGGIRGPEDKTERRTRVYRRTPDAAAARAKQEALLRGALAMYGLMRQQQAHLGLDTADVDAKLAQYRDDLAASAAAPDGTTFVRFGAGPAWCMAVFDDANQLAYLGPAGGYDARRNPPAG